MHSINRSSSAAPLAITALRAFSFMQQKLDRPGTTHVLLLGQALQDLGDANRSLGDVFLPYWSSLSHGVLWADTDWKNCNHYYHPTQQRGMWLFSNAVKECSFYFEAARKLWQQRNRAEAAFYLGAAMHLVQDLCVPFHTIPQLLMGHRYFEEYAERAAAAHMRTPCEGPTGQNEVSLLARENALFSAEYLADLLKNGAEMYDAVLSKVVPQALYSSKKVFELFIESV